MSGLSRDAAARVRSAAAAAAATAATAPEGIDAAASDEVKLDFLGRPVEPAGSLKERVDAFNDFTKLLSAPRNARVARVFALFTASMLIVPFLTYMLVFHVIAPRVGDTTIITPKMEDDDGNLVPDVEWTDTATMGTAHTVITIFGIDRSAIAGIAAVLVVLFIQLGYVVAAFYVDAAEYPEDDAKPTPPPATAADEGARKKKRK
jgi:hypothetical protein